MLQKSGKLTKFLLNLQRSVYTDNERNMMDSTTAKMLVIDVLAKALKESKMFKRVTMDGDHNSSEVIFTCEDGNEYVLSSNDIHLVE